MRNSVLIFGGGSDERLVSVASAQNLAKQYSFDELWFVHENGSISRTTQDELSSHQRPFEERFQPKASVFTKSIRDSVASLKGKTVYLGFHGTEGEDGTIQKLFEETEVAFTGSGSRSSQLCFDKTKAKETVAKSGILTAQQLTLKPSEDLAPAIEKFGEFFGRHGKIILKPVANGSSVGLFIISDRAALEAAIGKILSAELGTYMAENFIEGRELTVGVLQQGSELLALPASEVVLNAGHSFDYAGKYLGRGSTEITPANVTAEEMQEAKRLSLASHKALGCFGYSRTDMILTSKGPVYLETNTLPGLTRASFFPQQLAVVDIPMRDFIESQLEMAAQR